MNEAECDCVVYHEAVVAVDQGYNSSTLPRKEDHDCFVTGDGAGVEDNLQEVVNVLVGTIGK